MGDLTRVGLFKLVSTPALFLFRTVSPYTSTVVQNYWVFGKQHFGNWICFRPRVRGKTHTQLGPLERANISHWLALSMEPNWVGVSPSPPVIEVSSFKGPNSVSSPLTRGRKQIQFPKSCVFCFLEYRTMDVVQKPSNSVCYTLSSEPFRIYQNSHVLNF
jgi:hypothetical protein